MVDAPAAPAAPLTDEAVEASGLQFLAGVLAGGAGLVVEALVEGKPLSYGLRVRLEPPKATTDGASA